MKKLLCLLGIILLEFSCFDLKEPNTKEIWMWFIRNNTGQTLKLKFPSYSGKDITDYRMYEIETGTRIQIDGYTLRGKSGKFDDYFKKCASVYGDDVTWQISSLDNMALRIWRYSERDQSDQRFFIESSWETSGKPHDLTFEIRQEDILSADQ